MREMTNRRTFLRVLAGAATGVAFFDIGAAYQRHAVLLLPRRQLTLADWAKRMDPDGRVPVIVDFLEETNEILGDMMWAEGTLPAGVNLK